MLIKQAGRITKQREEAIDRVLTYISLAETEPMHVDDGYERTQCPGDKVSVLNFDRMHIWTLYESITGTTSYERLFHNPHEDSDIFNPALCPTWDFCSATFDSTSDSLSSYLFSIQRWRKVPLPSIRGMFKLRSGQVFELTTGIVKNTGRMETRRLFFEHVGKGELDCIGDPYPGYGVNARRRVDREEDFWMSCWIAKSASLTAEYDWHVDLGYRRNNSPMVTIPTDPISAKSIFKLRDVPPGLSRREAIKHWVCGHTRKSRDASEYEVTAHLRGAESFNWNGLECVVRPSVYDLNLAERLRKQAKLPA